MTAFPWRRFYVKGGVDRQSLYETGAQAVKDAYLSTLLRTSETVGILNTDTMKEWSYENGGMQELLRKYEAHQLKNR